MNSKMCYLIMCQLHKFMQSIAPSLETSLEALLVTHIKSANEELKETSSDVH